MANQEHLDILEQGIEVWNAWRKEYPGQQPDLSITQFNNINLDGADFSNTDLMLAQFNNINLDGANLTNAGLWAASLVGASLIGTNLTEAYLVDADLTDTNLTGADLRGADLNGVSLTEADLREANLSEVDLIDANLTGANLSGTNFTNATIGFTSLGDRDLRVIKGLETIKHEGPSPLSINTIYLSGGDISEAFLRGTGAPDIFIKHMPSLVGKSIEYYTCFISYSSKDQEFAQRLHNDLQGNGVRCWYAPEHIKIGDRIRPSIDEAIQFHDKLLLVLSASSVESSWVDYEVEKALSRERKEKRTVLFPVRLDDAVIESTTAWAAHTQDTRHIGDFTRWKEHDEYQKGLNRLLRDLKQEAIHDTIESDADKDQKQSTSREMQS